MTLLTLPLLKPTMALLGLLTINVFAMLDKTEQHYSVYTYSEYWQSWDEIIDIVDTPIFGKSFKVKELYPESVTDGGVRTHCTPIDKELVTIDKPPKKHMSPKQAKEWCKDNNDMALDILKDKGVPNSLFKKK